MNYIPKFDERAVSDATLVGAMHEAMIKDMLNGAKTSCKFNAILISVVIPASPQA